MATYSKPYLLISAWVFRLLCETDVLIIITSLIIKFIKKSKINPVFRPPL